MTNEEIMIMDLKERVRALEVELVSADRALKLAEKAVESKWGHILSTVAVIVSFVAMVMQFYKGK